MPHLRKLRCAEDGAYAPLARHLAPQAAHFLGGNVFVGGRVTIMPPRFGLCADPWARAHGAPPQVQNLGSFCPRASSCLNRNNATSGRNACVERVFETQQKVCVPQHSQAKRHKGLGALSSPIRYNVTTRRNPRFFEI